MLHRVESGLIDEDGIPEYHFQSTARIPHILHVCVESRHEALKHYQLAFDSHGYSNPRVYFDCSVDILFLDASRLRIDDYPAWCLFRRADVRRVQKLALCPKFCQTLFPLFRSELTSLSGRIISLKTLICILDGCSRSRRCLTFYERQPREWQIQWTENEIKHSMGRLLGGRVKKVIYGVVNC